MLPQSLTLARSADMKRFALGPVLVVVVLGSGSPTVISATRDDAEKVQCTKLQSRMDEIRLRRRMGYTTRQGRVYKQKLSALEAEYRARCR